MPGLNILPVETALLVGVWNLQITEPSGSALGAAESVIKGDFRSVLTSARTRAIFRPTSSNLERSFAEILNFSSFPEAEDLADELNRLVLAVACLHAFVQANWTGPDLNVRSLEVLSWDTSQSITEEQLDAKARLELSCGGEPAYHLAKVPVLLRLSQLLLDLPYKHLPSTIWWRLRAMLVHQQVLAEPAGEPNTILEALQPLVTTLASNPVLAGRLNLEIGLLHHHFTQDKLAGEFFVKAAKSTGLEYEVTGALGKRTKFQEKELSQLVLLAESHLDDESKNTPKSDHEGSRKFYPTITSNTPATLELNDEVLLEQTQFTTSHPAASQSHLSHINPSSQPSLHPLDQCILLSLCLNVRNTSPSHGLTSEQMSPYVSRVISHPCNWSIHTMALLLRSRLESTRTRTVERSTMQLQALIDQMPSADSILSERLHYFHSIPLPSKWEMERELAMRYLSLGVAKSALEIFERLEMWDEVVKCWAALERPERGIAIVRDLLEGRKSDPEAIHSRGKVRSADRRQIFDVIQEAKWWCLLGDLEPEKAVDHYERAWLVSKETSGRAMRSLGGYYFARAKYPESISCLKQAVAINPLLTRSWFILGCACMREENWEEAKNAFSRCVAIDEEDGESWNNLASMYLRMGTERKKLANTDNGNDQTIHSSLAYSGEAADSIPFSNKLLAFRALKEGLKYSYENWRMWNNYMIVAMDVGELSEASRALGRVIEETSDKVGALSVDEDVLDRLVNAVTRAPANQEDIQEGETAMTNPNEGHGLFRSVTSLFERTVLPRVSTPRVFRAYARLLTWQSKWEEALKAYLDGYRCGIAGAMEKGETDTVKWREAVREVEEIVDVLTNFGPRVEGYKWRLQGRSILRTFIGRTKDFEDEPEWERLTALQNDFRKED